MTTADEIRHALSLRLPVPDLDFDVLYPAALRELAPQHWSPIEVILRAARMLEPAPGERILDVGAGVGKVCIVGALAFPGSWYGIERDRAQVRAATELSRRLGVADGTYFLRGDLDSVEWRHFDGFYLFNPAASLLVDGVEVGRFGGVGDESAVIARIEDGLARTRPGARVVTYHGFGGTMPPEFDLLASEQVAGGELQLWIRRLSRKRRPIERGSLSA